MNSQLIGKVFGWGQFALTAIVQVFANGIPTSPVGWIGVIGSLLTAVGVHFASSTDGTK